MEIHGIKAVDAKKQQFYDSVAMRLVNQIAYQRGMIDEQTKNNVERQIANDFDLSRTTI